jgi:hypothetical protein
MQTVRTKVEAWSREDLVRAAIAMMKIAGWSLALIWAAYIVRFTSILGPIHTFLFGDETADQIVNAKAAWGQFGDFVGGTLNPMVSLLALVGLVFTILLQHEAMMRVQKVAAASQKALSDQTRLSLESARLQSLAAALEVTTEMHRQAVEVSHISAIELLKKKEGLAGQILEINERLARQAKAADEEAQAGAA